MVTPAAEPDSITLYSKVFDLDPSTAGVTFFSRSRSNVILPKSTFPAASFFAVVLFGIGASFVTASRVKVNLPAISFGVRPSA